MIVTFTSLEWLISTNHNFSAQSMWHHTCFHMNTYWLVLKAHLCMCICFFKHIMTKICQPHLWHRTHNHLHHVSHKRFFSPFTPHLLPLTITVYNPAWQGRLLQVPSSLLFHVNKIALSLNKKPITERHDSLHNDLTQRIRCMGGLRERVRDRTFCN